MLGIEGWALIRTVMTVLVVTGFVGIAIWAYSGRRERFDSAAQLPFADDLVELSEGGRDELGQKP